VRNFAPNTQVSYLHQVNFFARHFDKHRSGRDGPGADSGASLFGQVDLVGADLLRV
jgi:hypothetical protein